MALEPRTRTRARPPWGRGGARQALLAVAMLVVVAVVLLAVAVALWSGVTLRSDPAALARVELEPFAGTVQTVRVLGPDGSPVPVAMHRGRLTARMRLRPGEWVSLDVVVRRPGWLAWALGRTRIERLTVRVPARSAARTG